MLPEVMELVGGRGCERRPAVLAGFRRARLRDEAFPAVVPDPAARVEGVLWENLGRGMLARIDRFEGELYERLRCRVGVADGTRTTAWVYVLKPAHRRLLVARDWDEAEFRSRHLPAFLEAVYEFERGLAAAPGRHESDE